MKPNELMTGDWVYRIDFNTPVPVKIIGIEVVNYDKMEYVVDVLNKNGYNVQLYLNEIIPIPLTPEILEKNGFVKNRGITSWKFETDRENLIDIYGVNEYHLSINIEDTHGSGKGYRWMLNNLIIFYVHQLQHALRFCGITKEIEL